MRAGLVSPRLVGRAGLLDAEETWTPCYLFLPGIINLKIGVSRAVNLSSLNTAYSHSLFSSVSF